MCICGKENCNGLCEENLGKKLFDFYNNWQQMGAIRDVEIGNTELERPGSTRYLVVKGHQFYSKSEGIYSQMSRILMDRNKIKGVRLENIFKLGAPAISRSLTAYSMLKQKDPAELEKARKFYVDYLNYKKVLIPIDLEAPVEVMMHKVEREKSHDYLAKGSIKYIKWCLDENGKLECSVRVQPEKDKISKEKLITEFGREIIDRTVAAVAPDKANSVVQMSKFGFIKPIIFKGRTQYVAVDGTSIYCGINPDNLREIGYWEGNSIVSAELNSIIDTEILTAIKKYKSYMAVNRKKIAPYFISEANIVEASKVL